MSVADYTPYVKPDLVPRMDKAMCRVDFTNYPPPLEPLLAMWGPLSKGPVKGVTTDGHVIGGLYQPYPSKAPVEAAARAATTWLEALDPDTRARATFPVDSHLWRYWHNTPLILRDQVELGDLPQRSRDLALEVVRASLSQTGYERSREVMENNLFLGRLNDLTGILNEWRFVLTIFGTPSTQEPWGWQFFGHHLALNCLFFGEHMVLSPVFMGLEPDHEEGPRHRRMFEPHERQALALMRSLSETERDKAVLYDSMLPEDQPPGRFHPDDGRQVGGAFQDNRIVPYEGLPVGALGAQQQARLLDLASLFIANMPDGPAEARMREIERYLDTTHFAWIGKADDVNPFYFRIHSPVALIEFDHHSGIFLANKNPARFHVHSIVRSPNGGDFGVDLLRSHYAQGGHEHDHGDEHAGGLLHSHDGGRTMHRHD